MKKKRLLLILLFLLLIPSGIFVISPYPRQLVFGPKIQGVPLCAWQQSYRAELRDRDAAAGPENTWLSEVMAWFKRGAIGRRWTELEGEDRERLLLSLVDDNDPRVRREIAKSFFGDTSAHVKALLRLADDPDDSVCETAFEQLSFAGKELEPFLPRVAEYLNHADPQRRISAMKVIDTANPNRQAALAVLLSLLNDGSAEVRREAAIRFSGGRWTRKRSAQSALPRLTERMLDSDPRCRLAAAYATWKIDHNREDVFPVIARELANSDPEIREHAARHLGWFAKLPEEAVRKLGQIALGDENPAVRAAATLALGKGGKSAVPVLLALLENADEATQDKVLLAIAAIGTDAQGAAPIVARRFLSIGDDDFVPEYAWLALEATKAPWIADAVSTFLSSLEMRDGHHQLKAIKVLGEIGPDAKHSIPKLLPFLESTDIELKAVTVVALAKIGAEIDVLLPVLTTIVEETSWTGRVSVRLAAVDATKQLGSRARPLVSIFRKQLKNAKGEEFYAVLGLGAIGPEAREAIPDLLPLLSHKNLSTRWATIDSLGKIKDHATSVVPALISQLQHRQPPLPVTKSAIQALSNFGAQAKAAVPALTSLLVDDDVDLAEAAAEALAKIDPARFARKDKP